MNAAAEAILDGIAKGDKVGGPAELARIVQESLSSRRTLDVEDLARRYLEWWRTDPYDTGPTFALTMSRVASGMAIEAAVKETHRLLDGNSAGCGPAHRIAPLAACPTIPTERIPAFARAEARITHFHDHAGDAAAVVALLCRYLLDGCSFETAKQHVERAEPAVWRAIHEAALSPGGYSLDVVRTSLHFLDAEDSIGEASKLAGKENYCPVVVGAIEGARQFGAVAMV